MNLTLSTAWTAASWFEAARVRAAEVDLDHLYLGLLSIGGAAARLLGQHGVSLESARRQARAAMTDDLDALGLDAAGLSLPPPLSVRQVINGDPEFHATARAQQLINRATAGNTFDILVELLREPSKTVRRLVHADGIEPQELIPELKEGADDQYAAQSIPVLPGLLPERARAWRVHHYLSAPPEVVADVIASEQLLPTWSVASDTHRLDGDVVTVGKGSKTMSVQLEITRGHRDEVLTVDITQRLLDTKYAGEALSYDHFEVRPAPGGSEVIRDAGRRAFGLLGRAIAPFTGRVQTWGLLHSRYQIAFAVADRQAR